MNQKLWSKKITQNESNWWLMLSIKSKQTIWYARGRNPFPLNNKIRWEMAGRGYDVWSRWQWEVKKRNQKGSEAHGHGLVLVCTRCLFSWGYRERIRKCTGKTKNRGFIENESKAEIEKQGREKTEDLGLKPTFEKSITNFVNEHYKYKFFRPFLFWLFP